MIPSSWPASVPVSVGGWRILQQLGLENSLELDQLVGSSLAPVRVIAHVVMNWGVHHFKLLVFVKEILGSSALTVLAH